MLLDTLFASAYTSLTQICGCEISNLHRELQEKELNSDTDFEIEFQVTKESLLKKLF